MIELVEYLVSMLVAEGEYSVELIEGEYESDIVVSVSPKVIGKVIGKQGKIARAIRTLVKAATNRGSVRYNVIIEEKEESPIAE